MTDIVAFTGYAGSGKDTAARWLISRHDYHKEAFAGPLRTLCATALGWPLAWFEDDILKEQSVPAPHWPLSWHDLVLASAALARGVQCKIDVEPARHRAREVLLQHNRPDVTPREVLQFVGTDTMRYLHPTIWLEFWQERALRHERTVATDCRFVNEAALVRAQRGIVVRVHRKSAGARSGAGHVSESEIDCIVPDYEIHNEGTEEELWSQVEAVIAQRDIIDIESAAANVRPLALTVAGYHNGLVLAVAPHVALVLTLAFQDKLLTNQLEREQGRPGGAL